MNLFRGLIVTIEKTINRIPFLPVSSKVLKTNETRAVLENKKAERPYQKGNPAIY
jgi:hypothetical protein